MAGRDRKVASCLSFSSTFLPLKMPECLPYSCMRSQGIAFAVSRYLHDKMTEAAKLVVKSRHGQKGPDFRLLRI